MTSVGILEASGHLGYRRLRSNSLKRSLAVVDIGTAGGTMPRSKLRLRTVHATWARWIARSCRGRSCTRSVTIRLSIWCSRHRGSSEPCVSVAVFIITILRELLSRKWIHTRARTRPRGHGRVRDSGREIAVGRTTSGRLRGLLELSCP